MERTILSEEKNVYRIGDKVERATQPWSASIHRLLKHFKSKNLPVEHVIRTDNKIQISEFIGGEIIHPHKWTDDALFKVGELVSQLHNAAKDFEINSDDVWQPWCLSEIGGTDRIHCHGDIAPWNMITKNGYPICLVDWEFAGLYDPIVELARVCWLFVQLHDDDLQKIYDLPTPEKRAEQVRIIADAYGLQPKDRLRLIDQIVEVVICETAHEAIDSGLTFDSYGNLWGLAWRTRSLYWIWRHKEILKKALN